MKVIAVDPGYDRLGVAVVEKHKGKEMLIYSDCIETDRAHSFQERLRFLGKEFEKLLKEHKPDALAIEKLFFNVNQKTAMAVAEVRGMLIYLAVSKNLEIYEYGPQEIKVAVTGYGKSDKKQVADMLHKLISIEKKINRDDEYDAIAVGLTCLSTSNSHYPQGL